MFQVLNAAKLSSVQVCISKNSRLVFSTVIEGFLGRVCECINSYDVIHHL